MGVTESAEVGWVVATVRERLFDDVSSTLSHGPVAVDVFVRLRTPSGSTRATAAAPGGPSGSATLA